MSGSAGNGEVHVLVIAEAERGDPEAHGGKRRRPACVHGGVQLQAREQPAQRGCAAEQAGCLPPLLLPVARADAVEGNAARFEEGERRAVIASGDDDVCPFRCERCGEGREVLDCGGFSMSIQMRMLGRLGDVRRTERCAQSAQMASSSCSAAPPGDRMCQRRQRDAHALQLRVQPTMVLPCVASPARSEGWAEARARC